MGRRRKRSSVLEDIVEIVSRSPWWVGCLLAFTSFFLLHGIAGIKLDKPIGAGEMGSYAGKQLFVTLASFGQIFMPIVFGFASVVSLIKGVKQKKVYRNYEVQMGELSVAEKKAPFPRHIQDQPSPLRTDTINDLFNVGLHSTTPNTQEIEDPKEWTFQALHALEWKRFETVCTEYLRMIGYDPRETRIGADGGVDIWVFKPGVEKPVGIVQCKAWATYKVGVKPVRELYGVMAAEGVVHGKLVTSGRFTSEALQFAEGKKLELVSGERFLNLIRRLSEEKQKELLAVALEGDYRTPTCPQCGIKMTVRQGSNSRKFWGCSSFPRCRSTLVYKALQ